MSESGSPPAGAKSRRMSRTIASGLHTLSEHSCRPITGHLCVAQYQQLAGQRADPRAAVLSCRFDVWPGARPAYGHIGRRARRRPSRRARSKPQGSQAGRLCSAIAPLRGRPRRPARRARRSSESSCPQADCSEWRGEPRRRVTQCVPRTAPCGAVPAVTQVDLASYTRHPVTRRRRSSSRQSAAPNPSRVSPGDRTRVLAARHAPASGSTSTGCTERTRAAYAAGPPMPAPSPTVARPGTSRM